MTEPNKAERRRDSLLPSLVVGGIILAAGLWFFLDRTLGFEMPDISWDQVWPVILIVIGVGVIVGSMRR